MKIRTLTRRELLGMMAAGAAAAAGPGARAQSDWPSRLIKIIVPVAAAGIIDLLARNLAEALRPKLPAGIAVENRPGADQMIGTQAVARAPGDGYTWLCGATPFTTTAHLRKQPGFDPFRDFKPVALLATSPNVVVVPASLGVSTMQELIALGKRKQGGLSYANPGNGSSNHLGTEQLRVATGVEMLSVVYPGQPPAINDLLAGRTDFMLMSSSLAPPHVESGKLKALAVVAPKRLARLPNAPTIAEAGFPEVNVVPWIGVLAPSTTPGAIIDRAHRMITDAAETPGYMEGVQRIGAALAPQQSTAQFASMLRSEYEQWPELFKRAGLEKS